MSNLPADLKLAPGLNLVKMHSGGCGGGVVEIGVNKSASQHTSYQHLEERGHQQGAVCNLATEHRDHASDKKSCTISIVNVSYLMYASNSVLNKRDNIGIGLRL
jgi:hypothetical protein